MQESKQESPQTSSDLWKFGRAAFRKRSRDRNRKGTRALKPECEWMYPCQNLLLGPLEPNCGHARLVRLTEDNENNQTLNNQSSTAPDIQISEVLKQTTSVLCFSLLLCRVNTDSWKSTPNRSINEAEIICRFQLIRYIGIHVYIGRL